MPERTLALTPFPDFEEASRAVLALLRDRLGFGLWMMTRTAGEDWIVLQTEDTHYGVAEGTVLRWADSFCSRMVEGKGPFVAPDAKREPAYAEAPIAAQVDIGAYMGVPVSSKDGFLFGTLCAIDPEPKDDSIHEDLPLLQSLARLLGTILSLELEATAQARVAEMEQRRALTDSLSGLLVRRAWDEAIETEEARAKRHGTPLCAVVVDLDGLKEINDTDGHAIGDELIRSTGRCLREAVRRGDVVARLGGDEFGVLAIECDDSGALALVGKLRRVLEQAGVEASIGWARRVPSEGLARAVEVADERMYEDKEARQRTLQPRGPLPGSERKGESRPG